MAEATENEPSREQPEPGNSEEARAEALAAVTGLEDSASRIQQAEERMLRAQAELENFRKRARREIEEERRYANVPIVTDLLPVLDNLSRAVSHAEQNEGMTGLLEGVRMVAAQLSSILERNHCQRIKDLGEPFDPHLHEAVGQEASSEYAAGTVCRVARSGYRLHDRVVRPAQVLISTGPNPSADSSSKK